MLRRYAPIRASRGTTWPPEVKAAILARDQGCVGYRVGFPDSTCDFYLEVDHVRASHGIGLKSESTRQNGVTLCGRHHRWKTDNGKRARPLLLAYLARFEDDCGHVDPRTDCDRCEARRHRAADPLQLPEAS